MEWIRYLLRTNMTKVCDEKSKQMKDLWTVLLHEKQSLKDKFCVHLLLKWILKDSFVAFLFWKVLQWELCESRIFFIFILFFWICNIQPNMKIELNHKTLNMECTLWQDNMYCNNVNGYQGNRSCLG